MKNSVRNTVLCAALVTLGLEVVAVHLLLDLPLLGLLLADTVIVLVAAVWLWSARDLGRTLPADPRFSESRCQLRALRHQQERERYSHSGGQPSHLR
ncbi:hypothetical protein ACFWIA_25385 [Streptomyces sp. NPDC127068]|uniref:hypothetical protein n=1 Tax=Streptomyces sp. NPDC127068 TaxID=3347127 RepID=UPI0036558D8D